MSDSPLEITTIAAVSTPPGRGGIGVVRLSGPEALILAEQLSGRALTPREATYAILRDEHGARADDAVVTYFAAPHSYTGEDVVEIATHGAPVVLDWLLRRAIALGATPARAGEFTERAFLRGRIDLTQAEAVRDLIDSQTLAQAQSAAQQMGGSIAAEVRPVKDDLIALIAALEAGIDFAEDDIDTLPTVEIASRIDRLLAPLAALLKSFVHGRLLREGLRLAIVGKPNAGKSSLFNRLAERDRAIVTATPGTTRDVITEHINIGGIPVELLDTAGLRDAEDEAERIGVGRSRKAIADADAVLLVLDSTDAAPVEEELRLLLEGRPVVVAKNKSDLASLNAASTGLASWPIVTTSAATGEGITQLRKALTQLAQGNSTIAGGATLTNLRQRDAVSRAIEGLQRALDATGNTPHEMLLLDLYAALRAMDDLTGQTTADDVLNLIFSSFCIGK